MSQPVDPYRGDPGHPHQPYGGQPQGGQPHGRQGYGGQPYATPAVQPPQARPAAPRPAPSNRRPRRVPGLGLVLALLGLVVQVLSLTVLPWVRFGAAEPGATDMPKVWQLAAEYGTHGFGGWYVVLFSYPLAALGIVLALASVLESVALKMIWGGLTLIGLGILVVRYGFGPFADLAGTDGDGLNFTTVEIVIATVAVVALVAVIFMLRTAVSMFRRVAGLVLLGIGGVHVAAIMDLVKDSGVDQLSIGAYGPAAGYLLTAIAAFTGPRRLPGT